MMSVISGHVVVLSANLSISNFTKINRHVKNIMHEIGTQKG